MIPMKVKGSATLELMEKVRQLQAQGLDIISFAAGESDFPTPDVVIEECLAALKRGETRYAPTQGILPLREVIAADYRNRLHVSWAGPQHVLTSFGSKQGIYLCLSALLDPGDEVLIPVPYWVSYPGITQAALGKPVYLPTLRSNHFFPTIEELEKFWTPQTKAVVFSSPNNPTGAMIEKGPLLAIVKWCLAKKVLLIYDELYDRIVLGTKPHISALSLISEAESEYVVSINAASKSLAMTGWRMGYLVSSRSNIESLTALQSQMVTCLPPFIQSATAAGMREMGHFLPEIVETFKKRGTLVSEYLSKIPDIDFIPPEGAFYAFVDISKIIKKKHYKDEKEFTSKLLEEKGVVVLDGQSSGMPGWVRISFAMSEELISAGLARFTDFCLA